MRWQCDQLITYNHRVPCAGPSETGSQGGGHFSSGAEPTRGKGGSPQSWSMLDSMLSRRHGMSARGARVRPAVGARSPKEGPRSPHGVVAPADPGWEVAAGKGLRGQMGDRGGSPAGPVAVGLRRACPLPWRSGTRRNGRRPPAGGTGRTPGRRDPQRARRAAGSHRNGGPGSPRVAVLRSRAVGSIEGPRQHPGPGARGLPRSRSGRRGGHDARIRAPRCTTAPGGHGGRRPVRSAPRLLDRRYDHGAGPRRQSGGLRDARRPRPDGPLRQMVAGRRLLVPRALLRHRQHHPRRTRPVPADRRSARRFDRRRERGQRLADAARPRRPPVLARPTAP